MNFAAVVPAALLVLCAAGAAAAMDEAMPPVMDHDVFVHALLDRAEGRAGGGQNGFHWDGQAWIGTDTDKLWLKSEGFARGKGGIDDGRHELLYNRALTTFADLQAGLRTDQDSNTGRTWVALGLQGTAPQFLDYEATAYLSDRGHAALRLALSYDLLVTEGLILQPDIEMNFYSKADPGRRVGAGLADIDAGIRLRYEVSRKFAPYVGVAYVGRFGQTARLARNDGEARAAVQFVFGLRGWF